MPDRVATRVTSWGIVVAACLAVAGCASRSAPPRTVPAPPASSPAPAPETAVQQLYESGRYAEVVTAVRSAGDSDPEALWLAAHSHLRLGQRDQAAALLARVASVPDPAWQATARLAQAGLAGDAAAADAARQAAGAFPQHPYAQYELGLADSRRSDFAAAAADFDRSIEVNPRFAYAYYYAGLAYDRVGRADLMANRLETFMRLAPDAPERAEVAAILRTVRGR